MPTIEAIRDSLLREIEERRPTIEKRKRLLDGSGLAAPVYATKEYSVFGHFQNLAKTNFLPQVLSCYTDRLVVRSIRTASGRHSDEAWSTWRSARAGRDLTDAVQHAIGLGWGYLIALPHARKEGHATTRSLDPAYTITRAFADDPAETEWALVVSREGEGMKVVLFGASGQVFSWVHPTAKEVTVGGMASFQPQPQTTLAGYTVNPVVCLGDGTSILEGAAKHQERANQTLLHGLAIERYQSFRSRAFLNVALDEDEEGNPLPPVLPKDPSEAAIFGSTGDEKATPVSVWESNVTSSSDLAQRYVETIGHMAASCHVPAPYVLPAAMASVSADLLLAAEKVFQAHLRTFAAELTEALDPFLAALTHAALGEVPLSPGDLEVVFQLSLPQDFSLAADGFIKAVQAGLPLSAAMVESGLADPAQVNALLSSMESAQAAQDVVALLSAPPAAPEAS